MTWTGRQPKLGYEGNYFFNYEEKIIGWNKESLIRMRQLCELFETSQNTSYLVNYTHEKCFSNIS